ncbi:7-cyano-7-deazaguanine synthase [Methanobrevibacter curvatus]|nr:7-cyano-7-deazaguanine synthase [Methanobrevibacter curvatus]
MDFNKKIEKIEEIIKNKKVIISFSGGADSTLISYFAKKYSSNVKTITFDNGIMGDDFLESLNKVISYLNIDNTIIKENLLKNKKFIENKEDRCFICRNKMYSMIFEYIKDEEYDILIDGTNITDLLEDRPGLMVNYEKGIISPFVIAGLEKEEILNFLMENNIPFSKSTSCLGTRIAKGEKINMKKINMIKYSENFIKHLTKSDYVRVRTINETGIIELDNIEPLLSKDTLKLVENELKGVNFKKIALNIEFQKENKNELVIYKPCKDEANKIMFENELPYNINIEETCENLKAIGEVKCSSKMGVGMLEIDGKNITFFEKGKIVARKVENKENAKNLLIKVLPLIRRKL